MSDSFTEQQRRELAGRARTLHERIDGPSNVPEGDSPVDPERILDEWRELFSDEETFRERLALEDLTSETVREAASATHWPPDVPLPDWIGTAEALVHHVETASPGDGVDLDSDDEIPFRELLSVVAAFAREQLPRHDALEHATPPVEWLVERLSDLCVRPLYVEFKAFVKAHDEELAYADPDEFDDPPREYYESFVESMLDGGFRELCLEYPVLARQLARCVEFWIGAVTETVRRVEDDRPILRDEFGVQGSVTSLAPLADDVHARGRFPVRVSFEVGDVVYKPRSVAAGQAFYAALDRLEDHLSTPRIRKPGFVPRDGYGWMEPVPYEDLRDADAARRYYLRAGVVLCLAYVLTVTDCQADNVIARGEHPTLVDGETLLHPDVDLRDGATADASRGLVRRTPLLTHLLPFTVGYREDAESFGVSTIAGFGEASERRELSDVTVPSIDAVNSDVMAVSDRHPALDASTNTPSTDERDHPPAAHVDALVEGFEECHGTVRSLHADGAFLGSIVEPELLEGVENRFLLRKTSTYLSVLSSATGRAALRDGVRLTVEFEQLLPPFFDGPYDVERLLPIYAAERRALRRRDVPRLGSRTDGQALFHDGAELDATVDVSGVERCRTRLDRLDAADAARQSALVRHTYQPVAPPADTSPTTPTDERLLRAARDLFDQTVEAAITTPRGDEWLSPTSTDPVRLVPADASLYYGRCGLALPAAALHEATGEERYRRWVARLLDPVVATVAHGTKTRLGALRGVGSVVYSLSVVADLLDDDTYREAALDAARQVTADRLAADDTYDVMDGTAGALLGLLAYHERYGEPDVLDGAIDCGDRLLDARHSVDGYCVWETVEDGGPVVGMAHGQSGIAYALARLGAISGESRYGTAAREAVTFEAARTGVSGAVDDHGPPARTRPNWCRGRPGRALATLGIGDRLGDDALLADVRHDLELVADADPHPFDNLCCGTLGRAEVLLAAESYLDEQFASRTALLGRCLARSEANSALRLPGHSAALPNVSFFDGTAGVAYSLLRHRRPDALPCILLFE